MISIAISALMLACLSMLCIFIEWNTAGTIIFATSVIAIILSMVCSLYETRLSNKSLFIEIHDVLEQESQKK